MSGYTTDHAPTLSLTDCHTAHHTVDPLCPRAGKFCNSGLAIGPTPTSMRSSSTWARWRAATELRLCGSPSVTLNKIDCVVTSEDAVRPW